MEVWGKDENGVYGVRQLTTEKQFARIDCVGAAVMDIMSFQPEANNDIMEIITMIVHEQTPEQVQPVKTTPEPTGPGSDASSDDGTIGRPNAQDELAEYETEMYLCRWPNGDFSIVTAQTKLEAIIALDEWAGAHPSHLYPIDFFMADFELTDDGKIILNEFSAETRAMIDNVCYPELAEALTNSDAGGGCKRGGRTRVRDAVQRERTRLWDGQPKDEPETEL